MGGCSSGEGSSSAGREAEGWGRRREGLLVQDEEWETLRSGLGRGAFVPQPYSREILCVPKMLLFHWGRLPHLWQPERGLEL